MNVNSDLPELLRVPREDLDIELKRWMDPKDSLTKAKFAKELIALRNHGGGFLIIGFQDSNPPIPDPGRPDDVAAFSTDYFNNVLKKYAEPTFHCALNIVLHPVTGDAYPIVTVPGGATIPVRCKADSPDNGRTIRIDSYYIRRPGPESNTPQSGAEWDAFLNRCILARKQELASMLSGILSSGQVPATGFVVQSEVSDPLDELRVFARQAVARFDELREQLLPTDPARLQQGYFVFSARIIGDLKLLSLAQIRDTLATLKKYTGWSPMYVFTREPLAPYPFDDDILECWLGKDGQDAGHADFWRVSRRGFITLIRGYQEDEPDIVQKHGKAMDLTLPAWRLAEFLLRVKELGTHLVSPVFKIQIIAEWTGLEGRSLVSVGGSRMLSNHFTSHTPTYEVSDEFDASQLDDLPAVVVGKLVTPLLRRFSFFEPPVDFFESEIAKLTSRNV